MKNGGKQFILILLSVFSVINHSNLFAEGTVVNSYSFTPEIENEKVGKDVDEGHWIVNAADFGEDIPEYGRSLFDIIFSEGRSETSDYKIPFPFSKLVQKIEGHFELADESVQRVRIPIGRSLRRGAAAPNYFKNPRHIIAADGESKYIRGLAGLNLKGRLFLGHQENSNIVEIISYNPEYGRFEFQEIHGYGDGLQPKVRYAKRAVCLSCHQNAGPIFAKEPWLETDSNKKIKAHLPSLNNKEKYLPRFDSAWAIDYATDRANYFSSSQFIWQQGCSSSDESTQMDAIRCRAAMLKAIFQFRLLGSVDNNSGFRDWFMPQIKNNWFEKWPNGLLIATADIVDKDPFSTTIKFSEDPLNPRQPRAKWARPNSKLLTGVIYQTAEFLTDTDVFIVDDFLQQQAALNKTPFKRYQSNCIIERGADVGLNQYFEFSCDNANSSNHFTFAARGSFVFDGRSLVKGVIDTLDLPELVTNLRFLDLGESEIKDNLESFKVVVPIRKHKTRLGARLIDGTLLKQLEFHWPKTLGQFSKVVSHPSYLTTVNDIEPLYLAIDNMIAENISGQSDSLMNKPFRRHSILQSLHQLLGMPALSWRDYQSYPTSTVKGVDLITTSDKSLLPFYQHCSQCHSDQGSFPPGFLNGTISQAKQNIKKCAQKILSRLSMWTLDPEDRLISPMPPASWISALGVTESEWLKRNSMDDLQSIVLQLLATDIQKPPQLAYVSSTCL